MLTVALVSTLAISSTAAALPSLQILFVPVNVVPMDRERVLRDQPVLIKAGIIAAIGPHLSAPPAARVIDGRGRYFLSPGLADMHVHSITSRDMLLYLANGVIAVLHMGGERTAFMDSVVPKLNNGELPGPRFYSSAIVDGTSEYNDLAATPAEARAIANIAKTNGYDFIKAFNIATDTFQAFIDAGREKGLPVIGHGMTRRPGAPVRRGVATYAAITMP